MIERPMYRLESERCPYASTSSSEHMIPRLVTYFYTDRPFSLALLFLRLTMDQIVLDLLHFSLYSSACFYVGVWI